MKRLVTPLRNNYVILGNRLVLGTIYLLAGIGKLPDIGSFVDKVTGYGLLSWGMAVAYGRVLPWFELAVGIALILGVWPRIAAFLSIGMLVSFLVANGTSVYTYEYCHCFGSTGYIKTQDALVMDILMILLSFNLLFHGGGHFVLKLKIPYWWKSR